MSQTAATTKLFESDQIEWTTAKLGRRIAETRELIRRIDAHEHPDEKFQSIRAHLAKDLRHKEFLLTDLTQAA